DRPVEAGAMDQLLGLGFRCAVERKPGFARRERRDVDEEVDSARCGRREHRQGAGDIAFFEGSRVGGADRAGDVDDGIRAVDQAVKRVAVAEVAAHPYKGLARLLVAPGQRGDMMAGSESNVEQMRADEAGATGDRQLHKGDQLPLSAASSRSSSAAAPRLWMIASSSGSSPSSSGAEIGKMRAPVSFSRALTILERGLSSSRSALVSAIASGLPARPAPYWSSSPRTMRQVSTGSSAEPSTRWRSRRVRSTWPRKLSPMPAPSAAPSIRPGMSARTNSRPLWRTTPS